MWKRALLRSVGIGGVILQYGCIAHCTLEFVTDFVMCSGPSMQPTINPSDVVLTEHISVRKNKIEHGDIVIARSPINPQQFVCKRVTRMEGDIIENPPSSCSHRLVPRGHVWLEGDNKDNSADSRSYGPVPYGLLRGKVYHKVWPIHSFGSLLQKPELR